MSSEKVFTTIKKNWPNALIWGILAILLFSPGAKSWLLEQLIKTGLFNTEIKKDAHEDFATNADFSYADSSGIATSTKALRGKVIFINFWATWCPPCRAEMSSLNELYLKLRNEKNIVFLFINEDEDKRKGIDYLNKNNLSIPFYSEKGNVPNKIFGGSLPTTVVLNRDGKVVLKHEGMAGYNSDEFIKQLKGL